MVENRSIFDVGEAVPILNRPGKGYQWLQRKLLQALGYSEIEKRLWQAGEMSDGRGPFEHLLDVFQLDAHWECENGDDPVQILQGQESVLVLANHPFGGADAVALCALLLRVRPDMLVFGNATLARIPAVESKVIPVEIFDPNSHVNSRAVRTAIRHLNRNGMLATFPAGAVAHWQWREMKVSDDPWSSVTIKLAKKTGAPVLPIYICGRNSLLFQLLGQLHPVVRTIMLGREFLNRGGKMVEMRVGNLITNETLNSFGDSVEALRFVRKRVYEMGTRKWRSIKK